MASINFFTRFRTRLLLLVLLAVLPSLLLLLYNNRQQRRLEEARARDAAVALSQLAAANQENFIKNTRQLLTTLTQFPFLVLSTNAAFCETHFANLRKLSPDYLNFGLIELDGQLFCSGLSTNKNANLADRSYFQRVLQTKSFSIGDYQVGRVSGQSSLNFGYPVLDSEGRLTRVLFASLKLGLLSEAARSVILPKGGAITIIDRTGTVLARVPDAQKWIGKSLTNEAIVKWVLSNTQGVAEMAGLDGVPRLHAFTAISDGKEPALYVSVGIPREVSFAAANDGIIRSLFLIGLVLIAGLVAGRLYSNYFVLQPIAALSDAARRVASGDLSARTAIPMSAGELHELSRDFDAMVEKLQRREGELHKANEEIARVNSELEQRVKERTAQLTAANQELEAFSYSVSHDLRAPVRHIDGFLQLLRDNAGDGLDSRGKRYVGIIQDSAKRMAALIDDLLLFARMGRHEMRQTEVNMKRLVNDVITELASETKDRLINWEVGDLPIVFGDATMLRQVWLNLIDNAIKYTRPRPAAQIEIASRVDGDGAIIFSVRDNGVGFDMTYAKKLFGVFQRLHLESEFEGTGIGLANVRRIINRHGGRTWAEAELDHGATIYFSLPKTGPQLPKSEAREDGVLRP